MIDQKGQRPSTPSPHGRGTVERLAVVRLWAAPVEVKPLRGFQVALEARLPQCGHGPPTFLHHHTGEGSRAVVDLVVRRGERNAEVAFLEPGLDPRREHAVIAQHPYGVIESTHGQICTRREKNKKLVMDAALKRSNVARVTIATERMTNGWRIGTSR